MLITEEMRKDIFKLAKEICDDKDLIEKLGFDVDCNKLCYALEVLYTNDLAINSENFLNVCEALYEGE